MSEFRVIPIASHTKAKSPLHPAVIEERLLEKIRRLDGEQMQIVELVIAAIDRGGRTFRWCEVKALVVPFLVVDGRRQPPPKPSASLDAASAVAVRDRIGRKLAGLDCSQLLTIEFVLNAAVNGILDA